MAEGSTGVTRRRKNRRNKGIKWKVNEIVKTTETENSSKAVNNNETVQFTADTADNEAVKFKEQGTDNKIRTKEKEEDRTMIDVAKNIYVTKTVTFKEQGTDNKIRTKEKEEDRTMIDVAKNINVTKTVTFKEQGTDNKIRTKEKEEDRTMIDVAKNINVTKTVTFKEQGTDNKIRTKEKEEDRTMIDVAKNINVTKTVTFKEQGTDNKIRTKEKKENRTMIDVGKNINVTKTVTFKEQGTDNKIRTKEKKENRTMIDVAKNINVTKTVTFKEQGTDNKIRTKEKKEDRTMIDVGKNINVTKTVTFKEQGTDNKIRTKEKKEDRTLIDVAKNINVTKTVTFKEQGTDNKIRTKEKKEDRTMIDVAKNINVTKTVAFKEPKTTHWSSGELNYIAKNLFLTTNPKDKMAEGSNGVTQRGNNKMRIKGTAETGNSTKPANNIKTVQFADDTMSRDKTKNMKDTEAAKSKELEQARKRYIQRRQQLKQLETEMYEAIRETEGVWCNEVVTLYSKRYGRLPELRAFNIANIVNLLYRMKDVLVTPAGGCRGLWVCDAKAPHPPPPIPEPEPEPEPEPVEEGPWWDPCASEPPDMSAQDDALPGVPLAPDVFPADCMQPRDVIPRLPLPKLDSEFHDMKVYITAFYSPSHFWFRFADKSYSSAMEDINNKMTEYYEKGEGKHRQLCSIAMQVGQHCAAFHQYWCRAVIVRVVDPDHCKVLFLDYGLVLKLSIEELKLLPRMFGSLPAQAMRARQVGVRPPAGGQLWPRFSCVQFYDQTHGRVLVARICGVDRCEQVFEVYLKDPTTRERIKRKLVIHEGVDHGTQLIESGYAELEPYTPSNNRVKPSYTYPLFDAIELAATPSFHELQHLYENGFEPDDVPSFLKYVPPLEPIRCPTPPYLTADAEDIVDPDRHLSVLSKSVH